jgi:2-oxoglutarate ferredoxin oxidoreductase subunit beta
MLETLPGVKYLARTSTESPGALIKTKKAIKKAFQCQVDGIGFSMVEILSICPTNWAMTPRESTTWMKENMVPYFEVKEFKSPEGGK